MESDDTNLTYYVPATQTSKTVLSTVASFDQLKLWINYHLTDKEMIESVTDYEMHSQIKANQL